jgi:mono/diheme cytochrome c family protein
MTGRMLLALVAGGLLVGTTVVYRYVVRHGFSARATPSVLESAIAHRLRRLATPSDVIRRTNPIPTTPLAVAEGRDHFADHCALCHGNDGRGDTVINRGLYPPAPDLRAHGTQDLSDGEIFAIIENGIRFTGMPGWGGEAHDNWELVLFIRHLPDLTAEEIGLMRAVNEEEH